jgi:plastocyanin
MKLLSVQDVFKYNAQRLPNNIRQVFLGVPAHWALMNNYIFIALVAAVAVVLAVSTVAVSMAASGDGVAKSVGTNRKFVDYEDGVFKVRAGAGGPIAPLTAFFPQTANIKVGETVVWYNPSNVGEPHSITFVFDQGQWANFETAYVAKNVESFEPLTPGENAEPITFPGPEGQTVIVAANARVISPTVVSADGTATYLPPNGSYTLDGTEKYINSGFVWPENMSPQGFPEISTFSVKFDEQGTYNYICILHPWMTGSVVVQ